MRRPQRLIAPTILIALSGALAGCGSHGTISIPPICSTSSTPRRSCRWNASRFSPMGVPGLEQGVPKDLYKGRASSRSTTERAGARCSPPRARAEIEAWRKSKGKQAPLRRRRCVRRADPMPRPRKKAARRRAAGAQAAKRSSRKRTTAPPASRDSIGAPATTPQQSARPVPAPMPSGFVHALKFIFFSFD
jgi:hypothetical protein